SWDMLSTALTTVAFDGAGNPYQVVYPATPTYNTSAVPAGLPDSYGFELIPHRIFVGGFPTATSESELRTFFEKFGHVRETKVIRSGEGASKGYGFITFDSEEEAKLVIEKAERDKLEFRGRRLNVGPAVRRTIRCPRYPQGWFFSDFHLPLVVGKECIFHEKVTPRCGTSLGLDILK
uniref:RRM domain-containing protein n=1 Tax=Parascaris univalens TaxID=6257 RepID=A0A915A3V1_PARUN